MIFLNPFGYTEVYAKIIYWWAFLVREGLGSLFQNPTHETTDPTRPTGNGFPTRLDSTRSDGSDLTEPASFKFFSGSKLNFDPTQHNPQKSRPDPTRPAGRPAPPTSLSIIHQFTVEWLSLKLGSKVFSCKKASAAIRSQLTRQPSVKKF
jgi:hypothetical protein